jgi:hypothetical protein
MIFLSFRAQSRNREKRKQKRPLENPEAVSFFSKQRSYFFFFATFFFATFFLATFFFATFFFPQPHPQLAIINPFIKSFVIPQKLGTTFLSAFVQKNFKFEN